MGTRADFYVGSGKNAEWLGSIAYDGHPSSDWEKSLTSPICTQTTEGNYRLAVRNVLLELEHATGPCQGWPWPWTDSGGTDYAYCFIDGKVWSSCFGHPFFDPLLPSPAQLMSLPKIEWPDMTAIQKVDYGQRSGVMFLRIGGN